MQDPVTTSNYSIESSPFPKTKNFNKDEKTITTADLPF